MYEIMEIVSTSDESFSDAVKCGVEKIASSGKTVHWFEVIEQRGAVKDGKLKEFQVKLNVATKL